MRKLTSFLENPEELETVVENKKPNKSSVADLVVDDTNSVSASLVKEWERLEKYIDDATKKSIVDMKSSLKAVDSLGEVNDEPKILRDFFVPLIKDTRGRQYMASKLLEKYGSEDGRVHYSKNRYYKVVSYITKRGTVVTYAMTFSTKTGKRLKTSKSIKKQIRGK